MVVTAKKDNEMITKNVPAEVSGRELAISRPNQNARDAGVVHYLISKKKTPERLLELLQLGDPTFKEEDLRNPEKRQKAWRKVIVLVHPDHNKEEDATQLFQDSQNWYSSVCRNVQKTTIEKIAEFPAATYQESYDLLGDLPNLKHWHPWRNTSGMWGEEFWAAVACINLRGAHAFQKCPEISFSMSQVMEFAQQVQPATTNIVADMNDLLNKFGGCQKLVDSEAGVKEHIRL